MVPMFEGAGENGKIRRKSLKNWLVSFSSISNFLILLHIFSDNELFVLSSLLGFLFL